MATTELTLEGLRSLELLDAAATPGPWVIDGTLGQIWRGPIESKRGVVKGLTPEACPLFTLNLGGSHYHRAGEQGRRAARSDRNLIAEMRTRLPALLVAARRLLELESAMQFIRADEELCGVSDQNMTPAGVLSWARKRGWPGIGEPKGPSMCEDCEGEAATCFHAEDKQHLCDDCCDHDDGCNPVETRA